MTFPKSADIAIVGGGIAGATLALELARRNAGSIVLFEREEAGGRHSSGLNAGLLLQNVSDPLNLSMAVASRRWYIEGDPDVDGGRPLGRAVGSYLLFRGEEGVAKARRDAERAGRHGLDVRLVSPGEVRARIPDIAVDRFDGASFAPSDGVIDISRVVSSLLEAARRRGVTIVTGARVTAIAREGGRVSGVTSASGTISAGTVVNAAGGWAPGLGEAIGAPLPFRVTRRHLVVTEQSSDVDPDWPFTWDLAVDFYFRPEGGGLLFCSCDVGDVVAEPPAADPLVIDDACRKARALLPHLGALPVARAWAGLRTLTPDDRFVLGYDPRVPGLFWFAGLGGHGMAEGPAAAQVAADLIVSDSTTRVDAAMLSPTRFLG